GRSGLRGLLNIGRVFELAAANVPDAVDRLSGTNAAGPYFDATLRPVDETLRALDERTNAAAGTGSRLLGGLVQGPVEMAAGGPVGYGIVEGVNRAATEAQHHNLATAYEMGALHGGFSALSAELPIRFPAALGTAPSVFQRALYGALVGAGTSIAEPALEKAAYTINDLPDEAKRVDVFDMRNIAANTILSSFFGWLHGVATRPPPAPLVDAAMMEADAQSLASVARGAANPPQAADALHRIEGDAAIGLPAVESAAANGAPITEAARGEMQGQAERVLDLVRDHTADAPAAVPEPDTRPQLVEAQPLEQQQLPASERAPQSGGADWQPQDHEGNSVSASLTELQRLADQLTKAGAVIE